MRENSPALPNTVYRLRLKVYHTVIILLASTAFFGLRVLEIYWTEYGRTDADHMWGAGLAARHGTLRYIQDVGDILDPSTWRDSQLFRHDPEVFRSMVRPPGYLVLYDYPPVFALILIPFSYLSIHSFAAIWWFISVLFYLCTIWKVIPEMRTKFLFSAAALHFPPFLAHLEFGSTLIIVMGLAMCCGSLGVALAGWFKIYPWVVSFAKNGRPNRVLLLTIVLGFAGLVLTQFDITPFYSWISNLHQHQRAGGLGGILTWIRVGFACVTLVWALRRKWHAVFIFAVAQAASPVWWPWYWVAFVPVVGLGIHLILRHFGVVHSPDVDGNLT